MHDKWQYSLDITPTDQVNKVEPWPWNQSPICSNQWSPCPSSSKKVGEPQTTVLPLSGLTSVAYWWIRRSLVVVDRTSVPWPWFSFVDLVSWHYVQWLLPFVTYAFTGLQWIIPISAINVWHHRFGRLFQMIILSHIAADSLKPLNIKVPTVFNIVTACCISSYSMKCMYLIYIWLGVNCVFGDIPNATPIHTSLLVWNIRT